MIEITYRKSNDQIELVVPNEKLDAILAAADRYFLPVWSIADERRFREIMAADAKRRGESCQ